MPPKRRTRKKPVQSEESEDTDNNIPVKITRRSLRRKQPHEKPRSQNEYSDCDYDADSENEKNNLDLNCVNISDSEIHFDTVEKEHNGRNFPAIHVNKIRTEDKAGFTRIKDCSVRLADVSSSKWSSSIDSDHFSEDKGKTAEMKIGVDKKYVIMSKRQPIQTFTDNPKNKENVTPPDSHSTPALMKLVSRNLDESLFGFNSVESSLPFSPVADNVVSPMRITCPSQNSPAPFSFTPSITSPNKRKREKDMDGFYDLPIEKSKKQKTKKRNAKIIPHVEEDILEELRSHFAEVEMHELIIE